MKRHIAKIPIGLVVQHNSSSSKRLIAFPERYTCFRAECPYLSPNKKKETFYRYFSTKDLTQRWVDAIMKGKTEVKISKVQYVKVLYIKSAA